MQTSMNILLFKKQFGCCYIWSALLALYILIFSIEVTWAATAGNRDTSSTGTLDITVINNEFALIFGLNDVDLGTWSGVGDLSADETICVAVTSTIPTFLGQPRSYRLRATGDGSIANPNDFTLSNGVEDINYRVFLTDANGQIEMLPGNINSARQFIGNAGYNANINAFFGGAANPCINPNATISILVEEAELASGSGTHTGTLTLELSAE